MRALQATLIQLSLLTLLLAGARLLPSEQRSTAAQEAEPTDAAYPPPSEGRLRNLSTRGRVEAGDAAMISGFIVRDAPVQVVLRALGPDLARRDVAGTLQDPLLRLFRDGVELQHNDDWGDTEALDALVASGLAPADPREAAILTTLEPGRYTGIVEDADGGAGIGLVEIFQVDGAGTLANLSTRARVASGDDVLIGGLMVSGERTTVLIRAIGPDLAEHGVPGALQDPVLHLVRGGRVIAVNDDWVDSRQADFLRAQGLAPAHSKESAMVVTLGPSRYGGYTAVLSGAGGAGGVGLIEVNQLSNALQPVPHAILPPDGDAR
ncbi:MAG: hypothetical protein KDH92_15375 [Chloroflexi bacterium]|nr:hypothetical protein [Chloroflexota bacterium]